MKRAHNAMFASAQSITFISLLTNKLLNQFISLKIDQYSFLVVTNFLFNK